MVTLALLFDTGCIVAMNAILLLKWNSKPLRAIPNWLIVGWIVLNGREYMCGLLFLIDPPNHNVLRPA